MEKRLYYKIGEACKVLDIQPYVLRYWETEFPFLSPSKSKSGQRVYSERELEVIRRIKELLYEEGYTIAGAKKKLEAEMAAGNVVAETSDEEKKSAGTGKSGAKGKGAKGRAAKARSKSLDRDARQQIERMRRGIEKALNEARDILAVFDQDSR